MYHYMWSVSSCSKIRVLSTICVCVFENKAYIHSDMVVFLDVGNASSHACIIKDRKGVEYHRYVSIREIVYLIQRSVQIANKLQ